MEYEYVALACDDISALAGSGPMFVAQYASRKTHGWELFVKAPWHTTGVLCRTGVVIMRRPTGEPRMWTEEELRDLLATIDAEKKQESLQRLVKGEDEEGQPCDCGCGGRVYHGPVRCGILHGVRGTFIY